MQGSKRSGSRIVEWLTLRLIWLGLIAGCVAFWIMVAHVGLTWLQLKHAAEIAECRGDATEARETTQQLLSRGRFVRQYNPKTGHSVYTFRK
jgi:hypothetical protein